MGDFEKLNGIDEEPQAVLLSSTERRTEWRVWAATMLVRLKAVEKLVEDRGKQIGEIRESIVRLETNTKHMCKDTGDLKTMLARLKSEGCDQLPNKEHDSGVGQAMPVVAAPGRKERSMMQIVNGWPWYGQIFALLGVVLVLKLIPGPIPILEWLGLIGG